MPNQAGDLATALLERVDSIATWKRGDKRAPHKPLLMLFALGRFCRGVRNTPFEQCRKDLMDLLIEFGPPRGSHHPEYPFWWLQTDGLWVVDYDGPLRRRAGNKEPTPAALVAAKAVGRFPDGIQGLLKRQPTLLSLAADRLLHKHFPVSLHGELRAAVGLSELGNSKAESRRVTGFRKRVLLSYRYSCAVCGFSLRLDNRAIGLDAAHIKWRQANGPDTAENGLALCSMHHKLFDLGAFTLSDDRRVLVSERVIGDQNDRHMDHLLLSYHGRPLKEPVRQEERPHSAFVSWHRDQVFKEAPLP
jgi:putative restriction endonuclease